MPKVQCLPEVLSDIMKLPNAALKADCLVQLEKLEKNIHLGQSLFEKHGNDLTGCYKLFFGEAKYRIIYRIVADTAEVIVIGPRAKEQVYKTANQRLHPTN